MNRNYGYALGFMISMIVDVGVGILIVLGYVCYMRELVTYIPRSLHGSQLDPNGGQHLYHSVLSDYVVDEVLVHQRIFVDATLVLIEPLVDALQLRVMEHIGESVPLAR